MGYVGMTTAACFAELGNIVYCFYRDEHKLQNFKDGKLPIYEPGLEELVKKNINIGRLIPTSSYSECIPNTDLTFICVGTPTNTDGTMNLDSLKDVAKEIGDVLKKTDNYHSVIIKSTVLPGTTEEVILPILEKYSGKTVGKGFGLGANPEFLREGTAIDDFMHPDITVIGHHEDVTTNLLVEIYEEVDHSPFITGLKEAEMIKLYYNASHALKISFLNEIANICKKKGINVFDVIKAGIKDKKLVNYYTMPGCGFGGSCLPKDVRSLISFSKNFRYEPKLLEEVLDLNERQKVKIVHHLKEKLGDLKDKKIAVLGFSFKGDTNDVRESPTISVISELQKMGANIIVYDPKSGDTVKELFPSIIHTDNMLDAVKDADGCIITTDWNEFRDLNESDFESMRNKIIIEGRRVLNKDNFKNIEFEGIQW